MKQSSSSSTKTSGTPSKGTSSSKRATGSKGGGVKEILNVPPHHSDRVPMGTPGLKGKWTNWPE